MENKLYVSNLPYSMTEESLAQMFQKIGEVETVAIITDKTTRQSKGYGFVIMKTAGEAKDCIEKLSGKELSGRKISVSIAKAKEKSVGRRR